MQKIEKSILYVIVIALLLLMVSCDFTDNPSALVGHWLREGGVRAENKPKKSIELFKDGTGVCDGNRISWKVENERLILLSSLRKIISNYKVSNIELILTYDDGKSAIFVKKGYAEIAKEARIAAFKAKSKKGSFTDDRDSKAYKTLRLNKQIWMAENLNYNANGSKCYDNSESNCQKYGRLYDWLTAIESCPVGWHLPSNAEWQVLVDFAGDDEYAGDILKASSGWNDYNGKSGNGVDAVGFSALPGGSGNSDGHFFNIGEGNSWWSATQHDSTEAYIRIIGYNSTNVNRYNSDKSNFSSVRCIRN